MSEVKGSTPVVRPFEPDRYRYYSVNTDIMRKTSDFKVLNEDELKRGYGPGKRHEVRKYAGKTVTGRDSYYGDFYGIPKLDVPLRIKVGLRGALCDVYGWMGSYLCLSNRAKQLLESLDPEAFEFAECETTTRHDKVIEPYWLMDVIRVVKDYDEERSIVGGVLPKNGPDPGGAGYRIQTIYEFFPSPDMPKGYHAFYLIQKRTNFIFDQMIVDKWRDLKFSGFTFSPLQPASKKELKSIRLCDNSDYYFEYGRKNWEGLTRGSH